MKKIIFSLFLTFSLLLSLLLYLHLQGSPNYSESIQKALKEPRSKEAGVKITINNTLKTKNKQTTISLKGQGQGRERSLFLRGQGQNEKKEIDFLLQKQGSSLSLKPKELRSLLVVLRPWVSDSHAVVKSLSRSGKEKGEKKDIAGDVYLYDLKRSPNFVKVSRVLRFRGGKVAFSRHNSLPSYILLRYKGDLGRSFSSSLLLVLRLKWRTDG
jgi:hypothetical protein